MSETTLSEDELLPLPEDQQSFFDAVAPGRAKKHRLQARIANHKREVARIRSELRNRISKGMYACLRGSKAGASWEALVGYSAADLRLHLEARFVPGMGWHNMGEWHIDHIRPLASFNITGPECPDFREAWALENLQPLWAIDNMRKGARWTP